MPITIEDRVMIGHHVRSIVSLVEETVFVDEESKQHFWQEFAAEIKRRDLVQAQGEAPNEMKELSDEQGEVFGLETVTFGKYNGIHWRAVPYDYIAWLVDLNKRLELYVRWRAKKEHI